MKRLTGTRWGEKGDDKGGGRGQQRGQGRGCEGERVDDTFFQNGPTAKHPIRSGGENARGVAGASSQEEDERSVARDGTKRTGMECSAGGYMRRKSK